MEKIYVTTREEFLKLESTMNTTMFEMLSEDIDIAEEYGNSWVVQESDEAEPLGIIFDEYENDENVYSSTYWYDDFNEEEEEENDVEIISDELFECLPYLKKVNSSIDRQELLLWFNENNIDYSHMTDLQMYIYYIENNK